jgi:hypothetical protein
VAHDLVAQFDRLVRVGMHDDQFTRIEQMVQEHDAMIDAIQAHDAETASRLAFEHVDGGRLRILTTLRLDAAAQRTQDTASAERNQDVTSAERNPCPVTAERSEPAVAYRSNGSNGI